jgi:GT2 family glycosyltransferase
MNNPSVSVIIINYNHGHFLRGCLDSLRNQSHPPSKTIIVDNGSIDGSQEFIRQSYPAIELITYSRNTGFSQAMNRALRSTNDPFVLSLNPDVTAKPDFISKLISTIKQGDKIGIAVPKLLRADKPAYLDSTGLFINCQRRPYDRGQGEYDQGQYDHELDIFGVCGAAGLFRKAMLEDIAINGEYFDKDFFAYYEDADLSWRAQLRGWHVRYEPAAVATHVRGWGDSLSKQRKKDSFGPRLALRNRYLMVIKNDSISSFISKLPVILAAELPRLIYMSVFLPKALLGLWDIVRLFPSAWRKRKYIQENRVLDPKTIWQKFGC